MSVSPLIDVERIDTKESIKAEESPIIPSEVNSTLDDILETLWESNQTLVYTLKITAISEEVAKMRAKGFVRVKNPFEPSRVKITSSSKIGKRYYLIGAGVSK
jgi:hypothetical protein